jgi:hypothetical protein
MGPNPDAVVDDQPRVRGVTRLRIADASIMPTITSANTQAPTVMIAEFASELITRHEGAHSAPRNLTPLEVDGVLRRQARTWDCRYTNDHAGGGYDTVRVGRSDGQTPRDGQVGVRALGRLLSDLGRPPARAVWAEGLLDAEFVLGRHPAERHVVVGQDERRLLAQEHEQVPALVEQRFRHRA